MPGELDRFFDGQRWNRDEVVTAQRARAAATARDRGWELADRNVLSAPLEADVVEAFERAHRVRLPDDYRAFLLQVGDGGDGPGLYMRPLGAPFDDSQPWQPGEIHRGPGEPNKLLHHPFPHTEPVMIAPETATPMTTAGALMLFDHGCALWDLLVVTGDSAGQIWLDRLADGEGLRPTLDDDGERMNFARYYCRWLGGA